MKPYDEGYESTLNVLNYSDGTKLPSCPHVAGSDDYNEWWRGNAAAVDRHKEDEKDCDAVLDRMIEVVFWTFEFFPNIVLVILGVWFLLNTPDVENKNFNYAKAGLLVISWSAIEFIFRFVRLHLCDEGALLDEDNKSKLTKPNQE